MSSPRASVGTRLLGVVRRCELALLDFLGLAHVPLTAKIEDRPLDPELELLRERITWQRDVLTRELRMLDNRR